MESKSNEHKNIQKKILGEFIKSQRKLAQMSLRDLAERTNISNPYLSQIERGLHEPSIRILKAIAKALNLSAGSLLSQLGLSEDSSLDPFENHRSMVENAIFSDPLLTQYQKEVLIATYRHFTQRESRPNSVFSHPAAERSSPKRPKNKS